MGKPMQKDWKTGGVTQVLYTPVVTDKFWFWPLWVENKVCLAKRDQYLSRCGKIQGISPIGNQWERSCSANKQLNLTSLVTIDTLSYAQNWSGWRSVLPYGILRSQRPLSPRTSRTHKICKIYKIMHEWWSTVTCPIKFWIFIFPR